MDVRKEMWVCEGGSIFTVATSLKRFPGGIERPVRESVAFNVGDEIGKHLVKLHNNALWKPIIKECD